MIRTTIVAMLLAIAAGVAGSAAADTPPAPGAMGPQELVENSAKRMLVELEALVA